MCTSVFACAVCEQIRTRREKEERESDKEVAEVVLGVDEVPSLSGGLGRRGCYRLN